MRKQMFRQTVLPQLTAVSEVEVKITSMEVTEIDSFYFKFKNLLMSGQSANLTLQAEAGKASLGLTVEVVLPRQDQGNHHARQRRRERRATARRSAVAHVAEQALQEPTAAVESAACLLPHEAEKPSENKNGAKDDKTSELNAKTAAKASTGEVLLCVPSDEIESESISKETKAQEIEENDQASILSVIPLKHSLRLK